MEEPVAGFSDVGDGFICRQCVYGFLIGGADVVRGPDEGEIAPLKAHVGLAAPVRVGMAARVIGRFLIAQAVLVRQQARDQDVRAEVAEWELAVRAHGDVIPQGALYRDVDVRRVDRAELSTLVAAADQVAFLGGKVQGIVTTRQDGIGAEPGDGVLEVDVVVIECQAEIEAQGRKAAGQVRCHDKSQGPGVRGLCLQVGIAPRCDPDTRGGGITGRNDALVLQRLTVPVLVAARVQVLGRVAEPVTGVCPGSDKAGHRRQVQVEQRRRAKRGAYRRTHTQHGIDRVIQQQAPGGIAAVRAVMGIAQGAVQREFLRHADAAQLDAREQRRLDFCVAFYHPVSAHGDPGRGESPLVVFHGRRRRPVIDAAAAPVHAHDTARLAGRQVEQAPFHG